MGPEDLVSCLIEEQARDGLTDAEMAARLNLRTAAWRNARRRCHVSVVRLARWVARTRPELRELALQSLEGRNAKGLT